MQGERNKITYIVVCQATEDTARIKNILGERSWGDIDTLYFENLNDANEFETSNPELHCIAILFYNHANDLFVTCLPRTPKLFILGNNEVEWGKLYLKTSLIQDYIVKDELCLDALEKSLLLLEKTTLRNAPESTFSTSCKIVMQHSKCPMLLLEGSEEKVSLNYAAAQVLGYSERESQSLSPQTVFAFNTGFSILNQILKLNKDGDTIIPFRKKEGEIYLSSFRFEENVTPGCHLVSFEDGALAGAAQRQEEILESNRRFRLAAKTSKIGVWELDFASEYVRFDNGVAAIYGLPNIDCKMNRIRWRLFLHPDDEFDVLKKFDEARRFRDLVDLEYRIIDIRNEVKYLRVSAEVKIGSQGERIGMIGLASDITDYVKREKAIEKQNEKLRQISWTQSHLVRAPLAQLIGLIDLFASLNNEDRINALPLINSSAQELDEIIKETIKTAKVVKTDSNDQFD